MSVIINDYRYTYFLFLKSIDVQNFSDLKKSPTVNEDDTYEIAKVVRKLKNGTSAGIEGIEINLVKKDILYDMSSIV